MAKICKTHFSCTKKHFLNRWWLVSTNPIEKYDPCHNWRKISPGIGVLNKKWCINHHLVFQAKTTMSFLSLVKASLRDLRNWKEFDVSRNSPRLQPSAIAKLHSIDHLRNVVFLAWCHVKVDHVFSIMDLSKLGLILYYIHAHWLRHHQIKCHTKSFTLQDLKPSPQTATSFKLFCQHLELGIVPTWIMSKNFTHVPPPNMWRPTGMLVAKSWPTGIEMPGKPQRFPRKMNFLKFHAAGFRRKGIPFHSYELHAVKVKIFR